MAFRHRCGDRFGSLHGLVGIDMVRTFRLCFHDPGILRRQIVDTADSILCRFPLTHDDPETCFQEKHGT